MNDNNVLERGPHFVVLPHSIVVVGKTKEQAVLECVAYGNPEPSYKWFSGSNFEEEVRIVVSFFCVLFVCLMLATSLKRFE